MNRTQRYGLQQDSRAIHVFPLTRLVKWRAGATGGCGDIQGGGKRNGRGNMRVRRYSRRGNNEWRRHAGDQSEGITSGRNRRGQSLVFRAGRKGYKGNSPWPGLKAKGVIFFRNSWQLNLYFSIFKNSLQTRLVPERLKPLTGAVFRINLIIRTVN
jgi:hypothetical protein